MERGIEFLFTLEEWWNWWQTDDRWQRRGRGTDKLVMARFKDQGPYSIGNTYCTTGRQNVIDYGSDKRSADMLGWWNARRDEQEPSNTKRMSVTVTDPQLVWLRREAKKLGITVAGLIRRIIDQNRIEQR